MLFGRAGSTRGRNGYFGFIDRQMVGRIRPSRNCSLGNQGILRLRLRDQDRNTGSRQLLLLVLLLKIRRRTGQGNRVKTMVA